MLIALSVPAACELTSGKGTSDSDVIQRVVVTPATVSVDSGATQAFMAYGVTAGGVHVSGQFRWSATGGHINASGVFVADGPAGAVTVTATDTTLALQGHATVTVVSNGNPPPPPPPPPPPDALLHEDFDNGSFANRGWYDNTAMTISTAQHLTGSVASLEIHYPQGATEPTWGGASRHLFTPTSSVYLSYWVKYSTNWVGSGKPYHPHEFLFLTTDDDPYAGPSATHLTAYVEQNYQNGGIPLLELQDGSNIDQSKIGVDLTLLTENRAANGCNGLLDALLSDCYLNSPGVYNNEKKLLGPHPVFLPDPGPGYKGDWHFVEAYFQLNSILLGKGLPDGVMRYWFDGQLMMDQEHVLMRTGAHPTMQFNQLLIGPYIGDGSPVDQTMWVDDLTVDTARPATVGASRHR
ncbi:MAG: Ig-like domain-containing protein [Gemmatimonadales bacterium]